MMKLTPDELKQAIYDPASTQAFVLDRLSSYFNGNLNIVDPTNPFIFLLETNAVINSSTLQEFNQNIRKLYPIMATCKEDLYHHLVTSDLTNIFATPSRAVFGFYINIEKLKVNGNVTDSYYQTTIPKYTSITTNNVEFTLLNDIDIKYYKTGQYYVKIMTNTNDLSYQNTDLVTANIIKDQDGTTWLYFELELQQLKLTKYENILVPHQPFYKQLPITDKYVYLEAYTYFNNINQISKLNITYSQFYYNPDVPTLYVMPGESNVIIELPGLYIINDMVSKKIDTYLYTTKGNINLNLEKLDSNEFNISFNNADSVGTISSIPIIVKAITNLYGGKDETTFEELKNMVIQHTTGTNKLPITQPQIEEKVKELGLKVNDTNDTIIDRKYTVYKDIDNLGFNIDAYMDIYSKKYNIHPNTIDNYYIKQIGSSLIVNPFSVFEYDTDTNDIRILSKNEVDELENNTNIIDVISCVNNKKYVYTIYKYIIDTDNTVETRTYDINNTLTISNIENIEINPHVNSNGLIANRILTREQDNYYIKFEITNMSSLSQFKLDNIKVEIGLLDSTKTTYFYYTGNIVKENNGIYGIVKIPSNGYIDNDDNIVITNPLNPILETKIPINTQVNMVLYISASDTDIAPYENLNKYLYQPQGKVALYKEEFNINFATRLKYLYTNTGITYTPRKYKKYQEDVYLRYKDNVYKTDQYGIVLEPVNDGNDKDVQPVILHKEGDLVLDQNGDPIILHHKGDIVLDDNGNPVIDPVYGIMYTIDLLLLDYEFKLSTELPYIQYRQQVYKTLTDLTTNVLEKVNNLLLDNTVILYKPKDSLNKVKLNINNTIKTTPLIITPVITIYTTEYITDSATIENIQHTAKLILQEGLRNEDRLSDISTQILQTLGDTFISVNITNTDTLGNIGYKRYTPDSSRLVIKKILKLDKTNAMYTDLDVVVDIVKI